MAALHDRQVVAALLFAVSALAFGAESPPGYRLGDAATPTEYTVRLEVDPKEATFAGEARIALRVRSPTPVVWLHAKRLLIQSVEVTQGGRGLDVDVIAHGEDYLGLKARGAPFAAGEATAVFRYVGPIEPLAYRGLFRQQDAGESYVISQHEEVSARRTFPCFDEPGWKTPWTLTIDAPASQFVASNTPEVAASDVPGRAGWRRHVFAKTKPLPTYLVALAIGPFDVVDGGTAGKNATPIRFLAPKGRGNEARFAKEATPRILEMLEDYFGSPYPFEKLDSVALPGNYAFGAMENVGLITYGVNLILATPANETARFRRNHVSLAAHEIAHMWFGNYVTPAWWDDIWLNESFATWLGEKTLFQFDPSWDTGSSRARDRGLAIATDRLASARRVRNPVNDEKDLEGVFDSITYQKGGAVLEMFEAWLGKREFRSGVREYLRQHAWGSATSSDFFRAVAAASGKGPDTITAFEAFVDQSGVPLVDVELACGKGAVAIEVSQQRLRPKGSTAQDRQWTTPACFRYPAPIPGALGEGRLQCEAISGPARTIALAGAPACPAWVLGNAGGTGHYVTRYGPNLWKRIVRLAGTLPPHEAAALLGDTSLLAQSGLIPAEAALELAEAALPHRSPVVQLGAVRLLEKIEDGWLTPAQAKKKRTVIAQRVQPLARRVGWTEKPKDAFDVIDLRATLMPFAARSEGGATLRAEARKLALAWARDRNAVSGSMVPGILDTAARFADRATFELFVSLAATTRDGLERRRLHAALAKVRDPALRARALGLTLAREAGSDVMTGRDASNFLRDALLDEANRVPAFEYIRANYDPLAAKMSRNAPGRIPEYLNGLCTSSDREAFVATFRDRAPRYEGGRRSYDEALETIDLCIAART